MLEDAAHSGNQQVFLGVRHSHLTGLAGVLELVMGANHMHQIPAISLESLDDVGAFHCAIIHTATQKTKLAPPPGPLRAVLKPHKPAKPFLSIALPYPLTK